MISLGGYTDSDGKFRPIPTVHPSLSSHVALQEPTKHEKKKRLAGIGKLIGSKTAKAVEKGKLAKENHDKEIKVKRQTVRFQINDVLDSDANPKQKFHRIQELMIRNKKVLQKEDYHIYNKRLKELHEEMLKPPTPVKQSYRENDPFETLGEPTQDEKALNKLHEKMVENKENDESDKLSVDAKVSAIQ